MRCICLEKSADVSDTGEANNAPDTISQLRELAGEVTDAIQRIDSHSAEARQRLTEVLQKVYPKTVRDDFEALHRTLEELVSSSAIEASDDITKLNRLLDSIKTDEELEKMWPGKAKQATDSIAEADGAVNESSTNEQVDPKMNSILMNRDSTYTLEEAATLIKSFKSYRVDNPRVQPHQYFEMRRLPIGFPCQVPQNDCHWHFLQRMTFAKLLDEDFTPSADFSELTFNNQIDGRFLEVQFLDNYDMWVCTLLFLSDNLSNGYCFRHRAATKNEAIAMALTEALTGEAPADAIVSGPSPKAALQEENAVSDKGAVGLTLVAEGPSNILSNDAFTPFTYHHREFHSVTQCFSVMLGIYQEQYSHVAKWLADRQISKEAAVAFAETEKLQTNSFVQPYPAMQILSEICKAKFSESPIARDVLLSTGSARLHCASLDKFLGCGYCMFDEATLSRCGVAPGCSDALGKVLTTVRDEIKQERAKALAKIGLRSYSGPGEPRWDSGNFGVPGMHGMPTNILPFGNLPVPLGNPPATAPVPLPLWRPPSETIMNGAAVASSSHIPPPTWPMGFFPPIAAPIVHPIIPLVLPHKTASMEPSSGKRSIVEVAPGTITHGPTPPPLSSAMDMSSSSSGEENGLKQASLPGLPPSNMAADDFVESYSDESKLYDQVQARRMVSDFYEAVRTNTEMPMAHFLDVRRIPIGFSCEPVNTCHQHFLQWMTVLKWLVETEDTAKNDPGESQSLTTPDSGVFDPERVFGVFNNSVDPHFCHVSYVCDRYRCASILAFFDDDFKGCYYIRQKGLTERMASEFALMDAVGITCPPVPEQSCWENRISKESMKEEIRRSSSGAQILGIAYSPFSMLRKSPFYHNAVRFDSIFQAYLFYMALYFEEYSTASQMLKMTGKSELVKTMGEPLQSLIQERPSEWFPEPAFNLIYSLYQAKVTSDQKAFEALVQTGSARIHASIEHWFFGCGFKPGQEDLLQETGIPENYEDSLGIILTFIREDLLKKCGEPESDFRPESSEGSEAEALENTLTGAETL